MVPNNQIKSMQCTSVSLDANSLTTLIGGTITLTARVEPPGVYDVNFNIGGSPINLAPITTDPSGMTTLPFDTTGKTQGTHILTVDVVALPTCTSSPLTIALVTTPCTGIIINNTNPIEATIGDVITASATATITEPVIIEFVETTMGRFGSCVANPPIGNCIVDMNTTGATPGTYSVVAKVGNDTLQQCISTPVEVILTEAPGKIVVFAIPPGARIWYDGDNTGMNSSAIISNVAPGIHTVGLTLSGYTDYTTPPFTISPGGTNVVSVVMSPTVPPTGTGSLNVTSTPGVVEFFIISPTGEIANEMTPTPIPIPDIPAGIYVYNAGMPGSSEAAGSLTIEAGKTTNLHIYLPPDDPTNGRVGIESIPMGADIYINGLPINAKTSYTTMMVPGVYQYELRLSGYIPVSGEFTVVTGENNPAIVSVQLQQLQQEGAGVAMLAGVAVLGMMMLSKSK